MMMDKKIGLFIIGLWLALSYTCGAETNDNELIRIASCSDEYILKEGERLMNKGDMKAALLRFELLNARAQQNKQVYAQSLHDAGLVYYTRCSYSKAMECYMKSLEVCEQINFKKLLPYLYKDIANVYSMYHDYVQSSQLYKLTLRMAKEQGNIELTNKMLNNLVFAFTPTTPISQYKAWYREMCQNKDSRPRYPLDLLMVSGTIAGYEKNYPEAIDKFKKAVAYAKNKHLDIMMLVSAYASLADAYGSNGQTDSAIYYQKLNLQIANKQGVAALKINALKSLASLYQGIDSRKAQECKSEYLLLNDSIFNVNALSEIQNTYFFHEMDKKLNTINHLSKTNQANLRQITMQQRWIITLVICALLFLLLLAVIYRQNRRLNSAYKYLFEKSQHNMAHKEKISKQLQSLNVPENSPKLTHEAIVAPQQEAGSMAPAMTESADEAAEAPDKTSMPPTDKGKAILTPQQQTTLLATILDIMEHSEVFCQFDFGLDNLATLAQSNSRYVSQVINDEYGENFRTFLNEFRIRKAMTRMNDQEHYGNYTIKAIAESVGYKSQANFINVFTKITGLKPSTYLKLLREERQHEPTD